MPTAPSLLRRGRATVLAGVLLALGAPSPQTAPGAAAVRTAGPGAASSSAWLGGVLSHDLTILNRAARLRDPELVATTESGAYASESYDGVAWERLSGRQLPAQRIPSHWSVRSYSYTVAGGYDFAAADVRGRGGVSLAELVVLQRHGAGGAWRIDYDLRFFRPDSLPHFGGPSAVIGCARWCIALTAQLDRFWSLSGAAPHRLGDLAAGAYTSQLDRANAAYIARTDARRTERVTDQFSPSPAAVPYVIRVAPTAWIVVDAAFVSLTYARSVAGQAFTQNPSRTDWPAYLAPGHYLSVSEISEAQFAVFLRRVAPGSEHVAAISFDLIATTGRPG
ncbi:MAG TPA: hypothetical protein VMW47_07610 [Verrucomicrobiae bacterium]|nr:hypothetical protein [Verrucomicrobiae bacterium]